MLQNDLTALLITYNEAANIERVLNRLQWIRRVVVVDSGSNDGTLDKLALYENVYVVNRKFDGFASQCNFGLSLIDTEWVLSLDSDYELSSELVTELQSLAPPASVAGYRARFVYRVHGYPLRASLYPPRVVLYRRRRASYVSEGHGHRVRLSGEVRDLRFPIYHDDRKPLERWFRSQERYAVAEARHLLTAPAETLSMVDRLRRSGWPLVFFVPIYVLLFKRVLFDGLPGWHYVLQRLIAECMIALELAEARLRNR